MTAGEKCSVCGEILVEQTETPALGHDYKVVENTAKAATCMEAGNSAYWECENCKKYYSDEEGTVEIDPKDIVIKALGHDWKAATCTEPKTCGRCKET